MKKYNRAKALVRAEIATWIEQQADNGEMALRLSTPSDDQPDPPAANHVLTALREIAYEVRNTGKQFSRTY